LVLEILKECNRYYEMKDLCYDLRMIEKRVCDIFETEPEDIYSKSREKVRADARGLYCYWAVRELGYGLTDLARRLGMTQPGVGYAVRRWEKMSKDNNIKLKD
jgi:putative transposase